MLLALVVIGGAAGGFFLRQRAAERAAGEMALDPQERALRAAVAKAPADLEASRALGRYLFAHVRPYEAMWAFQDVLERRPDDAEARRGLARSLIVARLPRRALAVLAESPTGAVAGAPVSPEDELENRRVAAAAYLTMGDPLGAVTMLEVGGPALQSSPAALLDLGNAYEALGDDNAAGTAYRRLLQLEPNHVEGLLGLSRVTARRKRWSEALAAAAQARRQAPADPRPIYQYARALQTRAETQVAGEKAGSPSDDFLQVLRSIGGYGPAQLQLGLWSLRARQPEAAVAYLEQAVAARAGGDEACLRLAEALQAMGRKADAAYQRGRYYESTEQLPLAIHEYQRLGILAPRRPDVPLLLSAAYNRLGKNEPAAAAVESGCRRFPGDLSLRARYAMLLLLTDQRPQAANLCRQWAIEQPRWAEPYLLLARMEREALRPAAAAKLAEKAMALEPRNPEGCLEAAQAYLALAQPRSLDQAVVVLRQGLALDPRDAEMQLHLGEALERRGDLDGARLHYLLSMDDERNVRFGVYSLSQLCARLKQPARARFYAENTRALRARDDAVTPLWRRVYQNPADADAHAALADLLLQAGGVQAAIHQLEQTVRLRPDARKQAQLQMLRRLQEMRQE